LLLNAVTKSSMKSSITASKKYFCKSPNYNITMQECDGEDHLHILFKAHPNSEISKFINAYKSVSSRLVKKEFPIVREKLWKEISGLGAFVLSQQAVRRSK